MATAKLKLEDLRVQSFITSLEPEQLDFVKGGLQVTIQGKKNNYNVRWTSTDTRVEHLEGVAGIGKGKG